MSSTKLPNQQTEKGFTVKKWTMFIFLAMLLTVVGCLRPLSIGIPRAGEAVNMAANAIIDIPHGVMYDARTAEPQKPDVAPTPKSPLEQGFRGDSWGASKKSMEYLGFTDCRSGSASKDKVHAQESCLATNVDLSLDTIELWDIRYGFVQGSFDSVSIRYPGDDYSKVKAYLLREVGEVNDHRSWVDIWARDNYAVELSRGSLVIYRCSPDKQASGGGF